MRIILLLLIAVSPSIALAGQAVLTWTNSPTRTDGSALAASEIASTIISYGICASGAVPASPMTATAQGAATMLTIDSLGPGSWCFSAQTKDTDGLISAPSNVASKTIAAPAPAAPQNLTVSGDTAYMITTSQAFVALTPVGTVPNGAPCLAQDVLGMHVVDTSKTTVQWLGDVRPGTVVAQCSAP